jgi:hypothetical protein
MKMITVEIGLWYFVNDMTKYLEMSLAAEPPTGLGLGLLSHSTIRQERYFQFYLHHIFSVGFLSCFSLCRQHLASSLPVGQNRTRISYKYTIIC